MDEPGSEIDVERPRLVERDDLLATLVRIADDTSHHHGKLVLLSGEAGVGKTALVEALLGALPASLTLRRGACDNVTTPAPLGPFLEAAPELDDVPLPAPHDDNAVLFRVAGGVLSAGPTVVVLEDMHWADGASLDLLRYLGRRIDRLDLALIITFRNDEVAADHPLRVVLGDLATAAGTVRIAVPPLSPSGVDRLATAVGSGVDTSTLHQRTGGNAFYVTEVLATGDDDVPATVRDAVMARVSRLGEGARRTLGAAAVLGPDADVDLLADVAGRPIQDIDECVARGVLVTDGLRVTFRHELARRAVEESLTLATRTELHAHALAQLRRRGSGDDRRLAHHADASGDRVAVLEHGPRAAELAAARGAHREAAAHLRTVLEALPAGSATQADVLDRLATELCLTGHAQEALDIEHQALAAHRTGGDVVREGRALRWISRLSWMLGRGAVSDQFAHRAIEVLEPAGPGHELAMAYSNLAQIRMLGDDAAGAQIWGGRALALASDLDDVFVRTHALNNVGTALANGDRLDEGVTMLRESLGLALDHGFVDHAARAYCNLSVSLSLHRHHAEAEQVMAEGVTFASERDLDYYGDYITAMLATSAVERGAFADAERLVERLLRIPHLAVVTRIPALTVQGLLDILRGDGPGDALGEAWRLAEGTREPQRLVPVALAMAEAAWVAGRPDDVTRALDILWTRNAEQPHPWRTGELAWRLHAAGAGRDLPGPAAEPFALMLDGRNRDAAARWRALGSPVWAARALATSDDVEDVRHGLVALETLGALGVRDAVMRDRYARGLSAVRGPRASSAAHPAGLTTREAEVLQLLGQGMSNAEIAATLFVTPKTVGHHVSAVLRKLETSSRARAVAVAAARGLLMSR
jgi:DNA-binding CsgD family transcriptional regulator/tetratricopeptide (TPR) repeat protein